MSEIRAEASAVIMREFMAMNIAGQLLVASRLYENGKCSMATKMARIAVERMDAAAIVKAIKAAHE